MEVVEICHCLADNDASLKYHSLVFGVIPEVPNIPENQKRDNISNVRFCANSDFPRLDKHDDVVGMGNINLEFGSEISPNFKRMDVVKNKCGIVSSASQQRHLETREIPFCLSLSSTGIQLWISLHVKTDMFGIINLDQSVL
ncbi:UNVERIFIED_CONTAM: hypothetical protein Slati_4603700 [Sesamum latifolium]|uniref:Uncharacterized protein n=1 Tax=Sesamum latifolium TaxID=2727402 RepID=A0AAW2S1S4_9LAMI